MKKIISLAALAIFFSACEKNLDSENYTKKNTGNFPSTVADANQMITGIYSTLSAAVSNSQNTSFYMAELASDDRFGGGGENDKDMQGLDHLMNTKSSRFESFWTARYQGIYRANTALENLDKVTAWENEAQKNQLRGEAHFLRAFFYFELSEMFGEVPLVISTTAANLPKSPADETYAQIAYDLNEAITLMSSSPYSSVAAGHATKWAAQALMARVFLFYTGYYNKTELPVANEGGSINKAQVTTWIDDCIDKSGHGLVDDFRNLWPYTNEFTAKDYDYVKDNDLLWAGDGNKETVFAVKFGTSAGWGSDSQIGYANQYALHFGLRSNNGSADTFPFGQGWGAGPVNSKLWNDWKQLEPNDIRRTGSIMNGETDVKNYIYGADSQMEETGFWQKKYIPIRAYDEGTLLNSYAVLADAAPDDMQLGNTQDLILIRFSDVLLMQSELKEDAGGLNKVRARVDLPAVPYSLAALKKERRWELAFEGLRYFDLMRWGDAANALAAQEGVAIKNKGIDTQMKGFGGGYKARYEATGGFWPIPESQILLSEGVLVQNAGWGTPAAEFTGW